MVHCLLTIDFIVSVHVGCGSMRLDEEQPVLEPGKIRSSNSYIGVNFVCGPVKCYDLGLISHGN